LSSEHLHYELVVLLLLLLVLLVLLLVLLVLLRLLLQTRKGSVALAPLPPPARPPKTAQLKTVPTAEWSKTTVSLNLIPFLLFWAHRIRDE
jgi:hypothetical protein